MYFVTPIQPITISITGFSMDPLPDLDLIDGKSEVVFDLDSYLDLRRLSNLEVKKTIPFLH